MQSQPQRSQRPVSVVIPVFNRRVLALRAVRSVLEQTHTNFQLIVVDDGSTDRLADAVAKIGDPRITIVHHHTNRGASAARNTGVRRARHDLIAFLDSDDVWVSTKLERQLTFMTSFSTPASLCCTAYRVVRGPRGEVVERRPAAIQTKDMLQFGCRLSPGSTLIASREIFDKAGFFDEALARLEDWDWLLRCTQHVNVHVHGEVLSIIHQNGSGPSYTNVRASIDRLRMVHLGPNRSGTIVAPRKFRAALDHELAVAALRNGLPLSFAYRLISSFIAYPIRDSEFFLAGLRYLAGLAGLCRTSRADHASQENHVEGRPLRQATQSSDSED